jgi:hypothetical protein
MTHYAHALCLFLACVAALAAHGQDESPLTRLFDTGALSAAPLTEGAVAKRAGWTLVPEDKVDHPFAGDAVMLNDKLAVVLRKQGRGAEVYSKSAGGLKLRANAGHAGTNSAILDATGALKILENSSSAVMVQASAKDKPSAALSFRLTTGEAILELRSSEGAESVSLRSQTRYLVVPDYFGDDLVFETGAAVTRPSEARVETSGKFYLPTENFCLNLLDGGDAMVMTVWAAREQEAWLALGDKDKDQGPCASQIRCLTGKSVWLAFLESPRLWRVSGAAAKADGTPPCPAKWRCSLLRGNGLADSWTTEKPDGARPDRSAGFSPLPLDPATGKRTEAQAPTAPLLVYPIDRSGATPLTVTCPTDVMRNTLGVGPCQYILACEGLSAQGDPTPDSVMKWVEKQFEQKKQKKAADDIKERLGVMVEHVAQAKTRMQRYAEFAGQLQKALAGKPGAELFRPAVDDLARFVAIGLGPTAEPAQAKSLAGEVAALVGKDDSLAKCQQLGERLRSIGAVQDGVLARCRMAVRRLQAQSRTMIASQSLDTGLAQEIQKLTDQMLQNK